MKKRNRKIGKGWWKLRDYYKFRKGDVVNVNLDKVHPHTTNVFGIDLLEGVDLTIRKVTRSEGYTSIEIGDFIFDFQPRELILVRKNYNPRRKG